ncbi:MAG: ribonuclease HII [Actinomycetota bacterium]|nr:ribonuclease HII [Actinomycetota bacterium]
MELDKKSVAEIRAILRATKGRELKVLAQALINDRRVGARRLAESAQTRLDWGRREDGRLRRLMKYESDLARQGYSLIAGADEVGRGALAGPLVAAAVILRSDAHIIGINDSKKLTASQREQLVDEIKAVAVAWTIAETSQEEIDSLGLQSANMTALSRAVESLDPAPDFIICDGFKLKCEILPSMALIKGDSLSQTVAAASILAKVYRDNLMRAHHDVHPDYGFNDNKGYATASHIEAIKKTGPCALHRRSFYPVSEIYKDQLTFDDAFLKAEYTVIQDHGKSKV